MEELVDSDQVDELIASAEEYISVHEERKLAEKRVESLKQKEDIAAAPLKDALGKNIKGKLTTDSGDYIVTWNPISRTKLDTEKLKKEFPTAYEECVKKEEESYRTFKLDFKENKVV